MFNKHSIELGKEEVRGGVVNGGKLGNWAADLN